MKKIRWMAILVTLSLLFALSGCEKAKTDTSAASKSSAAAGKTSVFLDGSTSVGPLAEKLAAKYMEANKDIDIQVQLTSSGTGITSVADGSCDIGMASRDLKQEELDKGLKPVEIALDGIAVILNQSNSVSELTKDQIFKIFSGEIKNWKDVGGEDEAIIVVSRDAGSGTRTAFEELLKLEVDKQSLVDDVAEVFCASNGEVRQNIALKQNAIGYLSIGLLDDTVKAVKVDGVAPTKENIISKAYAVSRPFLFVSKGELSGKAKEFEDFILSDEGQKIVNDEGYVRVDQ